MTHVRTSATLICLVASLALTGCGKSSPKKQPAAPKAASTANNAANNDDPKAAKAAPAKQDKPAAAPKKKVKVTLWHAYRDAERKALDQIIDGWNKAHPETQVTTLAVPFDALIDKAQVAIPRGNGPDLIIFAHDKVGVWARDQLIQPLGDFATGERLKRFLPQTVKPLVFERAVYGLPLAFKSTALFYNKKLVPTPPKTVAELVTMSKKLTDAKAGRFGLAYDAADLYYHASWLHGFGGQVFDETSRSLTIDSPAAIQAAERVRALHKNDGVLPKGMTGFVVTAMFNEGKVGFVINGPWFLSEVEDVEYGVAVLPELAPGKPLKPYLGSEAVMLSAKTKLREAALQVADHIVSDASAKVRLNVGRQLVANKAAYDDPKVKADAVISTFRAQANQAVPMPNAVEANVAWAPYSNALRKIVFGDAKAADALKTADAQAKAAAAKLRK